LGITWLAMAQVQAAARSCPLTPIKKAIMSKLSVKTKEELKKLLPPTIYFFIALHIVAIIRILMMKGTGISPGTPVSIAIAAPGARQSGVDCGFAAIYQSLPRQTVGV
jgi:hypothetical protein